MYAAAANSWIRLGLIGRVFRSACARNVRDGFCILRYVRVYIYRRANLYYSSESGAWRCRSGLSRILFASSSFFCYKMPRWADLKNLHSVRFNINIYTLCICVYWLIDNSSFAFIKRFYVTVKCSDGDDVKFAYAYIYIYIFLNECKLCDEFKAKLWGIKW